MSFPSRKKTFLILSLCLIFVFTQVSFARDDIEWKPITQTELSMTKPVVEEDADAEAIFWDVTLDDSKRKKMTYYHYVRVKIFTERGREKFSKFDIPFIKKRVKIENIAARVIKPDGTIINLPESDIFERELVKANKLKIRAKSFAVPGIEPGVIVEYQYEEIRKGDSAGNETLVFQRDIPMQSVSYRFRPYKGLNITPKFYNMPQMRFERESEKSKYFVATLKNVEALKEEPYMPPEDEVRKWAYLTAGSGSNWLFVNRYWGLGFKEFTKPNKKIKRKVKEVISGATSEEDKLRKIYDFVQKDIKNIAYDSSVTEEQMEDLKLKDPDDVIKRGMATPGYIDFLFASMARAAGFNVNLVLTGDRSELFFHPNKYPSAFVNPTSISVKVNGEWRFFNPGAPFLPFGKLIWYEENIPSMLISETGYLWKTPNLASHKDTLTKRTGKLNLLDDGTLEGDVKIEYFGHSAISRRQDGYRDSDSKREEDFEKGIKQRLNAAEISNLTIENFKDNEKPLIYKFKLRVPNYAQKAGSRIFFQPGVFEFGASPVFSAAERIHPIYFSYPWSEEDHIEIMMPDGFDLDNADTPDAVADPSKIGSLNIKIGVNKETNKLVYKRNFYFGDKGHILFQKSVYTPLKNLFDAFHKADSHTIALKKSQ